MDLCGQRAILVITQAVEGTSTNVARSKVELRCALPAGHQGPHHDVVNEEQWEGGVGHVPTLLRHEDEERDSQ
jgi:hypothetical protein